MLDESTGCLCVWTGGRCCFIRVCVDALGVQGFKLGAKTDAQPDFFFGALRDREGVNAVKISKIVSAHRFFISELEADPNSAPHTQISPNTCCSL